MSQQTPRSIRRREHRHPHLPATRPPTSARDATDPLADAFRVAGHGAGSTGEFNAPSTTLPRALVSLGQRDFRLFWGSQILSLVGTWMQAIAQSWLVLQLTNSPIALGIVNALQFLPILFLSVLGGVIADRLPKRSILIVTQSAGMLLALVLGYLTATDRATLGAIMALALLLGFVTAVDMPTRQAFVVELVKGQNLTNAIALNSAAFNAARLIGPAAAGLAIGAVGIAGCFYLNGLSFVFPVGALFVLHAGRQPLRCDEWVPIRDDLRAGFAYVQSTPIVRAVVLIVAVVGTFGMNVSVLVPLLARNVLQIGASGYGYLTAATGVGALAAALLLAHSNQASRRGPFLASVAALGLTQVLLAGARDPIVAGALLAALGFAMITFTTLANATLQLTVPDVLRGRVMSLYTAVFAGTAPIGSLFAGGIAAGAGVGVAFLAGGLISLATAAFVDVRAPRRGRG